ncbi:MAG: biosynthetic-type acetolactate synthase large subunit [Bacteroidetes bacterium]|nr:biosynthetic-type acetolactate synthase large subunit [Bacteroidota bacterium]MBU1717817.1 biosynthetic-type acetolactate synthase large subunit [Bacteroidota bacterium]
MTPAMKIKGSEALIKSLLEEGADTLFGYIGGAIMPVYDALYDYSDRMKHYLMRHEQGAIHATQAYSRVTGKTGVCFATSGPGATNIVTGLADAQLDSTPLICITGQVHSALLGTDAFQEQDMISISMPVTKWNFQITKPEEIGPAIAKAFYVAGSGRPGPVLIDFTKDAQMAELEFSYEKCTGIRSYFPIPKIDHNQAQEAATLINNCQKPLILAGHGTKISGAQQLLLSFAEKTGIPVSNTLLGLSGFPQEHPLYVGMLGMHGNYGPNIKTNDADLLIAIGMRFDDRVTGDLSRYAINAKVIHIDIDKSELSKNVKADIPILADARQALDTLLPLVQERKHDAWLKEFKECQRIENEVVVHNQCYPEGSDPHMGEVARLISEMTHGEAIIVTDVGQHQMITARYYRFAPTSNFITSGGLGTMGFGLPAAFGAAVGAPHKQVIAVIGDGGFQMTIQELGSYFQHKIPVKIILLNNNFLGMVRQWQEMFFNKRYSYTEMINPDFIAIAKGYHIPGRKITDRSDLPAALQELLNEPGTRLLEIVVRKEENVMPMVPAGESVSNIRLT